MFKVKISLFFFCIVYENNGKLLTLKNCKQRMELRKLGRHFLFYLSWCLYIGYFNIPSSCACNYYLISEGGVGFIMT